MVRSELGRNANRRFCQSFGIANPGLPDTDGESKGDCGGICRQDACHDHAVKPDCAAGGGFGIDYNEGDHAPGVEVMAHAITEAIAVACQNEGIAVPALAFEPGRAIVGRAGVTLYNVGTIKDVSLGDGHVRKYVSVDGGMSDNARTALYQAEYSTRLVSRVSSAKPALVRVVGKHCESGDIVVRHDYLPGDIAIGDTIAVAATGAYCFSLGSNYNFLPRPPVVAVADGKARLIVRGESEADMLSRDVGIKKD